MYRFLLLSLFCIALFACESNTPSEKNESNTIEEQEEATTIDTLFIHARTGLQLRKAAAKDAERLATLTYGTPFITTSQPEGQVLQESAYGPYQIKGQWLKGKTADGKEGYLFAPYLFPFSPKYKKEPAPPLEWLYQQYAPNVSIVEETTESDALPEGAIEGKMIRFSDEATYQVAFFEGGISYFLEVPKEQLSVTDALILFRSAYFQDRSITTEYDEADQAIIVSDQAATLIIKEENGKVKVTLHAG